MIDRVFKSLREGILILLIFIFFLTFVPFALAATQSHPLSELTPIDVNLNMSGYNITNASYVFIQTQLSCNGCIGSATIADSAVTSSKIASGAITTTQLTSNLGLGWNNLTGYPSITAGGGLTGGGDLSASRTITLSPTLGINWANISTYNLNSAWTGSLGWGNLTYPNGCGSGQAVQVIGSTLTCVNLNSSGNVTSSGGIAGYIPQWETSSSLNNSAIFQNGSNVGIGTTGPTAKLTISGDLNFISSAEGVSSFGQQLVGTTGVQWIPSGGLAFKFNGTGSSGGRVFISNAGYVGIATSTTTPVGLLQVGASVLVVATSGNVGIGTTSPNQKLEVVGNINATGDLIGRLGGGNITSGTITATQLASDIGLGFANLTNYPTGCGAGQAVQIIGDTLTCVNINQTAGVSFSNLTMTNASAGSQGLVGYWTFDEGAGSKAYDASGYSNTGTLTNMNNTGDNWNHTAGVISGWNSTACKYGSCLGFDGSNDYVVTGSGSSLQVGTTFTIEAWIKPNIVTSEQDIATWEGTQFFISNYDLRVGTGTACSPLAASAIPTAGFWYHVVWTQNSGTFKIYINGIQGATGSCSPNITSSAFYIGSLGGVAGYNFNGTIDDVKIYNRALSADEIKAEYLSGADRRATISANNVIAGNWVNATNVNTTQLCLGGSCQTSWPSGVNNMTGAGTAGYIPQWQNSSALNNSAIYQTGGNIGIGTTTPNYKLDVAGIGSFDYLKYKKDSWTSMTNITATVGTGGSLVYTGGDYIYALRGGGTTDFYRYSISTDSWTSMTNITATVGTGGSLVYTGGDYIYALRGGGTADFYRYSISGNSWTAMTSVTAAVGISASLVYTGGDYIYALRGHSYTDFYRYSISGNSWTSMTSYPIVVDETSSMTYTGGDYIYAASGWTNFYRYSISGNSWTAMTSMIVRTYGVSLTYTGGNYVYARAGPGTPFSRYSISTNSWTVMASPPTSDSPPSATSLVYTGGDNIYTLRYGYADFYRYTVGGDAGYDKMASAGLMLRGNMMAETDFGIMGGNVGIGTTAPTAKLQIEGSGTGGISLNVTNDLFVNDTSGNVGIGTTSPLAKLHVGGNYDNDGTGGFMLDAYTPSPDAYSLRINPFVIGTGKVGYQFQTKSITGGVSVPLTFNNAGNVGIGTTSPGATLAVNGTLNVTNTTGTNALFVNTQGNVGIGTTTPQQKLDVIGYVNATSGFIGNLGWNNLTGRPMTDATGLVGYWSFSEGAGSTTNDASGNSNTGTLTNMNTTGNATSGWNSTGCKYGSCLKFDGVNDYVNAGTGSSLNITGALTIEAWVKPDGAVGAIAGIVGPLVYRSYNLGLQSNGRLTIYLKDVYNLTYVAVGAVIPDVWNHIVLTYDKVAGVNNLKVYVGGIEVWHDTATGDIGTTTDPVWIGKMGAATYLFNGTIDEVRIYNRTLSADEIIADYSKGIVAHSVYADNMVSAGWVNGTNAMLTNNVIAGNWVNATNMNTTQMCLGGSCNTAWPSGTNNMTGAGTAGYIPQWQNSSALNNSNIYQLGSNVGIGTTSPSTTLDVNGQSTFRNTVNMGLNRIDWTDSDAAYYLLQVADYNIGVQWDGVNNYLRLKGYSGGSLDYQTTPVLTWTSSNVGIGTTTPTAKLQIEGSGTGGISLNVTNDLFVNDTSGNVGIGTTGPTAPLHIYSTSEPTVKVEGDNHAWIDIIGADASEKSINFYEGASLRWKLGMDNTPVGITDDFIISQTNDPTTPEFIIKTSGNVGIGTTAPNAKLEVRTVTTAGNQTALRLTHAGGSVGDNVALEFLGAGGVLSVPAKIVGEATGSNDIELGIWSVDAGIATERVRIDDIGNVGIGTAAPNYKLEVNGTSYFGGVTTLGGILDISSYNVQRGAYTVFYSTPVGVMTLGNGIDANLQLITNIGNANTDFTSGGGLNVAGNVGIGTIVPSSMLQVTGNVSLATSSGNVGIGTTSPNQKLEVVGGINATTWVNATNMNTSQLCLGGTCNTAWPSGAGNTTAEIRNAVNGSLVYQFTASDLSCADCIGSTEITGITQGDLASTFSINWGNVSGYNLNSAWTGSLGWGNLTGYSLNSVWTGTLHGGNITSGTITATQLTSDLGLGFANLTNYPAGCSAGQAVQVIGDSLTCVNINQTAGVSFSNLTMTNASAGSLGLVGYWTFDEGAGSYAYDASGYGNTGTLTYMNTAGNATSGWNSTACKYGSCLKFDGVDDYVAVPNSASLNITDAITAEAWIYPRNWTSNDFRVVGKGNVFWLTKYSSTGFNPHIRVDNAWQFLSSSTNLDLNQWQHVAITYDSVTRVFKGYKNGVEIGSVTLSGLSTYKLDSNTNKILIGTESETNPTYPTNGTIDEVRIYNRALSADEIKAEYLTGASKYETTLSALNLIAGNWVNATNMNTTQLCLGGSCQTSWPSGAGNTTTEIRNAVNSSLVYQFTASDLSCADCIGSTEITGLTQGDLASTFSINWGNLSTYNLNSVWTGTLHGGNITAGTITATQLAANLGLGSGNITGGVDGGGGPATYIPLWNGTNTLNNSMIFQNGSNVGIGTTSPGQKLSVAGSVSVSSTNKVCLDGDTCSKYMYYNGTNVVIQG